MARARAANKKLISACCWEKFGVEPKATCTVAGWRTKGETATCCLSARGQAEGKAFLDGRMDEIELQTSTVDVE